MEAIIEELSYFINHSKAAGNIFPANIYLKSTRKTLEKAVFIVNFEHVSHLFLVFVLLTLNK